MKQPNPPESNWQPCAPGTLSQYAGRERTRQRNRILAQASGAMAVLFLCAATSYWAWQSSQRAEPRLGGLLCAEVQEHMGGYVMNQLDPKLMGQMREHLAACAMCQKMLQQMQASPQEKVSLFYSKHTCPCEHCQTVCAHHSETLATNSNKDSIALALAE